MGYQDFALANGNIIIYSTKQRLAESTTLGVSSCAHLKSRGGIARIEGRNVARLRALFDIPSLTIVLDTLPLTRPSRAPNRCDRGSYARNTRTVLFIPRTGYAES